MRVIQVLPTIAFGDAVSNDAIALKKVIEEVGFPTQIYAENVDYRLPPGTAECFSAIGELKEEDIIIYHESVGTSLNYVMRDVKCHVVMRYHNITPPHFFEQYNRTITKLSRIGLEQTQMLAEKVEYVLADSEFNKQDLVRMGYKCPIDVLPVVIPLGDYEKRPDYNFIQKYNDDYVNILFVGRVVPNKKQEDLIRIFNYYKTNINHKSRLILVGNYEGMESYKERLDRYIQQLNLQDVHFVGHIKFDQILALYKVADIFLCMSEHEGFCVPLVEAMKFRTPIIAFDSCAVGNTMGKGGILVDNKEPETISLLMDKVLAERKLIDQILMGQSEMLDKYSYENISEQFAELLLSFIDRINEV